MNKLRYRTYKFGNLIISKTNNEIAFIYKGRKKNFSKVVYTSSSPAGAKKYIYAICFLLLIGLAFYIYNNIDFHSYDNALDEDDKQKNELLLSKTTDYSEQEKTESLQIREHLVIDGNTLSELAKEYGVSMDTICGSNNLHSYDIIRTGKKLKIPNKDGILHTVAKGQSVNDIANKYKVTVEKIFTENNKKNFDFISVGEIIFVPDAKPTDIVPGFMWPARNFRITSRFGWRRHPISRTRQFHQGIDIRSNHQLIRATKYGKVTYTGWMGRYGNVVIIAHPGGWKSLYGHLSRFLVKPGQYVKQGQWIAKSGNTGYSTGPHLHFELRKNGVPKNPYNYLLRR
ncbi:MAG: M23 family metallopeptidase [Spirochaetes bacterium]|nr:M23 family metallopeptidase [Spirochaetota bacterium]